MWGGVRENLTFTEKIEESKKILRLAEDMSKAYYGKPIVIAYSGGKDSQVLLDLAEKCLTDEFDWYIKEPLDNHNYDRGTSGDYEIIDSDIFENDPNRIYVLSKDKQEKPYRVTSMEVEILAWCSIPDDPINPFKGE